MAAVSVKRSIVDATCHRHVSRRIQSPVQKLCTTGTFCRLVRPDLSCYNCKTWVFKKYIYFYLYLSVKGWVEQNKAIVVDGKPISICTNLQRWNKFNDPLFTDQIPTCIKTGRQLQARENKVVLQNTSLPGTVSSNWGKATSVPTTPRSSFCSWHKQSYM